MGRIVAQTLDNGALDCIAEVIRHSRTMASGRATSFLSAFASLLGLANPAGVAIKRALGSKKRDALLDLIQVGDYRAHRSV